MKRSSKFLISLVILLPIILVITYFIAIPILEKVAKEKAISSIEDQVGAQVNLANVEIKPFKQQVILHRLEITNPYQPVNNIVSFKTAQLDFRLIDYWKHKTIYLKNGLMSDTKIDLPKSSKKAGWVDRKRYPIKKEASLKDRITGIDLSQIKNDFKDNFKDDLKKTAIYQEYESTYQKYKSKIDIDYKKQLKDFESDFKQLSRTKVDKRNLAKTLGQAQALKKRFDGLNGELRQLKELRSFYNHQGNLLNKAQSQVIENFLNRNGFGDLNDVIQEKVQSFFKKENKAPVIKKTVQSVQAMKMSRSREDVLFFVEKFLIKGKSQDINGEVLNLHNKNGEDFQKWLGSMKLSGELKNQAVILLSAQRLQEKFKDWVLKTKVQNFSLDSYDFFSFGKISKGLIDIDLSSLFGDTANMKALIDINLEKITTDDFILNSLKQVPLKLLLKGHNSSTRDKNMSFTTKLLTKLPSLTHPLKSKLLKEIGLIANQQKGELVNKTINLPELSNYKDQINRLTSKWKKQGIDKIFKGLLKKF